MDSLDIYQYHKPNFCFSVKGTTFLEPRSKTLRLNIDLDFANYYKSLVEKYFYFKMGTPAHGAHISVVLPFESKNIPLKKMEPFHQKTITVRYDPYIYCGGHTKNFRNFFVYVYSPELDNIKKSLQLEKDRLYWHITICSTKGGTKPYIH